MKPPSITLSIHGLHRLHVAFAHLMAAAKHDRHDWCRGSRSSLHYDPYHNLLCMVQGKKTVKLMSPDVTDQLYPFSVLGESPNHSHVNFAHPDDQQHPLYKQALQSQQEFVLQVSICSPPQASTFCIITLLSWLASAMTHCTSAIILPTACLRATVMT